MTEGWVKINTDVTVKSHPTYGYLEVIDEEKGIGYVDYCDGAWTNPSGDWYPLSELEECV